MINSGQSEGTFEHQKSENSPNNLLIEALTRINNHLPVQDLLADPTGDTLQLLRDLSKYKPAETIIWQSLADVAHQLGHWEESRDAYHTLAKLQALSYESNCRLAEDLLQLEQYKEAFDTYQQVFLVNSEQNILITLLELAREHGFLENSYDITSSLFEAVQKKNDRKQLNLLVLALAPHTAIELFNNINKDQGPSLIGVLPELFDRADTLKDWTVPFALLKTLDGLGSLEQLPDWLAVEVLWMVVQLKKLIGELTETEPLNLENELINSVKGRLWTLKNLTFWQKVRAFDQQFPLLQTLSQQVRHILQIETGSCTLSEFLTHPESRNVSPHILFDTDWYKYIENIYYSVKHPLVHFFRYSGGYSEKSPNPNPYFDCDWYRKHYLENNQLSNPLLHYISHFHEIGVQPNEYFDNDYVHETQGLLNDDPLTFYLQQLTNADANFRINGFSPSAYFDRKFYLDSYSDIKVASEQKDYDPYYHFIAHGKNEGRRGSPLDANIQTIQSGPQKTLIITGFHRSGTSMAGKLIAEGGLYLGDKLMPGDPFNPFGYFEDTEIVGLHDAILAAHNTSWLYDGSQPLAPNEHDVQNLVELVINRNKDQHAWGFKDPRACLLLDVWSHILGQNGCYFFIFRHYSQCIRSLYSRQSKVLSLNHVDIPANFIAGSLTFWLDGDLAARLWLAYNKKLLTFFKQHREHCLLIPQQAILSGFPLVQALNNKFNLNLDSTDKGGVKSEFTDNNIHAFDISGISPELIDEMESLWQALIKVADAPSEPDKVIDEKPIDINAEINRQIQRFNNQTYYATKTELDQHPSLEQQIRKHIEQKQYREALELLPDFMREQPLTAECWELAGLIYLNVYNPAEAERCCLLAIALNPEAVQPYKNLGLAFMAQNKTAEAEHFLLIAASKKQENPECFYHLGKLYKQLGRLKETEEYFNKALDLNLKSPEFVIDYSQLLLDTDRNNEAKHFLIKMCNEHPDPSVIFKLISLHFELSEYDEAKALFKKRNQLLLEKTDLRKWLDNILTQIPDLKMRENFQYWVCQHWSKVKA